MCDHTRGPSRSRTSIRSLVAIARRPPPGASAIRADSDTSKRRVGVSAPGGEAGDRRVGPRAITAIARPTATTATARATTSQRGARDGGARATKSASIDGQRAAESAARPRTTAARSQRGTGSGVGTGASAPRSIASTRAAIVMLSSVKNGWIP
jgi:hypothetical protein